MRRVLGVGLLGGALLVGIRAVSAESPRGLDQSLAADLEDVPLADALTVIARHLNLRLDKQTAASSRSSPLPLGEGGVRAQAPAEPAPAEPEAPGRSHVTLKVPRVPAEVLLLVLAWQTSQDWVFAPGVLRWGPARGLPTTELTAYRRERALRLEREASLLRRRLSEPVPFRLNVEGVPLADLLRFLERELPLPLFLDPRASDELVVPVRSEFTDMPSGATAAQLLDRLLLRHRSTAGSVETGEGTPSSLGSPGPLGWTVVGDLVVVSTPGHLYSLRSLSR